MYDPNTSLLAGMSESQLRTALSTAQTAYMQLMTGTRGVEFSYAQGDGTRSVKYDQLDLQQLVQFIKMLKLQLGMPIQSRRPIKFRYSRG